MVDEGVDGWKSNFCITNRQGRTIRVCRVDNFLFEEDRKKTLGQVLVGLRGKNRDIPGQDSVFYDGRSEKIRTTAHLCPNRTVAF